MVSSPLMEGGYERTQPDYGTYLGRALATDTPLTDAPLTDTPLTDAPAVVIVPPGPADRA
jgi:hypothetical protein